MLAAIGIVKGRPFTPDANTRAILDRADARVTFRKAGGAGVELYKVRLTDVVVSAITQVAGTGAQYPLSFDALLAGSDTAGFLDEVPLVYSRITWEYQPTGPSGKPAGPAVPGGCDLRTNRKI